MGTNEPVVQPSQSVDHLAIDKSVAVPRHVREAAEAADALHKQIYERPEPEPQPDPPPPPEPPLTATVNDLPPPPPPPPQDPPPSPQSDFIEPATPADLKDSVWAQRYNSMQGRWSASQREIGQLRTLVDNLGDELRSTQAAVAGQGQQPPSAARHHEQLITDKDRETFGEDLIDVASRAARQAVQPEMDALRGDNEKLKRQVTTTAQGELKSALTRDVPNWIAINRSPDFKNWLRLRNAYTGEVRGIMLNTAYQAANAPQVIQLFRDFINEVRATGGEIPGLRNEQSQAAPQDPNPQPPLQPAPRTPAIQLDTLAAPGRARPAGGDSNVPADKPTYTRQGIAKFYADVRRGLYAGREADKNQIEADIIAAQSQGRVLG